MRMIEGWDRFLTWLIGGGFSTFAYVFGGMDQLLTAFIVFMICDFITGVLAAGAKGKLSSPRGYTGVKKKIGMAIFIIVAVQLDHITGQGDVMRNAVLFFLIGVEGISILENLGSLGLPIPSVIKKTLERFVEDEKDPKDPENKNE